MWSWVNFSLGQIKQRCQRKDSVAVSHALQASNFLRRNRRFWLSLPKLAGSTSDGWMIKKCREFEEFWISFTILRCFLFSASRKRLGVPTRRFGACAGPLGCPPEVAPRLTEIPRPKEASARKDPSTEPTKRKRTFSVFAKGTLTRGRSAVVSDINREGTRSFGG